ncbi:WXG100 family type VII secretion target [Streptomyces brasiliscabiei]|uniref:WXG100 family type VII secretion target n=1 Tax=Streptomyces brasiliscabiei TaxID=2736302 RepID=UPI001C111ADC|nr:WXG100 family type VII secretion target [Streptomyces brasiliscabiei]
MTDKGHEADLDRVGGQNGVTDIVRGFEDRPQSGFLNRMVRSAFADSSLGRTIADRTDFEKRDFDLNQLIDLVERTDPEDLESSGKALWDARDAIKAAADELEGHIDNVHWVGESGDAFRKWGGSLVTNTHHLSDFAGAAGDQITAAAVGLASVRGAMPSRDPETSRKRPEHFTEAEKAADKGEYEAAVRVEKDRQEAINQMNRLASYYAVSEEVLASLPAKDRTPEFTAMPDVGVPRPAARRVESVGSVPGTGSHTAGTASSVGQHAPGDVPEHGSDDRRTIQDTAGRIEYSHEPVRTRIDSVGTLPPSTPVTGHTPPTPGTPAPGGGQPSVFEGGLGTPVSQGTAGRNPSGTGGLRTPASAQGRTGAPGSSHLNPGRSTGQGPMNQMGRPTSTGPSAARGMAPGSHASQMGRAVTGGTPRAAGTAAPRANSGPVTGAGRANGVVGGRPAAAAGPSANGGPRIPRGTVVGGEEGAISRPAPGRPGQRGVLGTPESTVRPSSRVMPARGGTGTSDAVTGRPATSNTVAEAERNGLTRGGAGLVRGSGHGRPGEGGNAQESPRLDHQVDDEEAHLPNRRRRDVPPVVN